MAEPAAAQPAPPSAGEREEQARQDAIALIVDSHDLPYHEAIRRLAAWMHHDPARLVFCCWQLACWHDPNRLLSVLEANTHVAVTPRPKVA